MNKTFKITLGVFLLLVVFLTYLEATEPKPVNWSPSYMPADKIPLGSFVFFESWKNNTTTPIEEINVPPFEYLDQEKSGTYFFLNNQVIFDNDELSKILDWVNRGNTLFISAKQISANLLDTLDIEHDNHINEEGLISKAKLNLVHPELKSEIAYEFKNEFESVYFSKIDTTNHLVLGTLSYEKEEASSARINFIKASLGEGEIFMHATPEAFSNYFLLTDHNYQYSAKILSYLDQSQEVLWDNYYKSGKTFYTSPLYVLLDNQALKWAYYFIILGSLAFIIFEGKRKQRPIPVVAPLKNQSYEYTKTIANLYLEQNRYRELTIRKIDLFLEFIREEYRISTQEINQEFYSLLASRSGNNPEETRELFHKIKSLRDQKEIGKNEFLDLSQAINNYKN